MNNKNLTGLPFINIVTQDEKAEKNAKSAQKRKIRDEKRFQIAFEKELLKREKAAKRSSTEEVSQAHSSSAASTAYKPKKQRVYEYLCRGEFTNESV